ncbi:hypothetical protein K3495_g1306 [Podosphaera aphanis]|nr:hypothetical protein K3495_g1306 [Podosphaera aphanis]
MDTLTFDISSVPPDDKTPETTTYFSSIGDLIKPKVLTQFLENQAFEHAITGIDSTQGIDPHPDTSS